MDYYNSFFSSVIEVGIRILRFFNFLPEHASNFASSGFWYGFKTLLLVVSLLAAIGVLYLFNALAAIDRKQKEKWHRKPSVAPVDPSMSRHKELWQEVVKRLETPFEADWKLAILEADTLLSDLLIDLGYTGETLAEKLKKVSKDKMVTLDYAWNAHRMRNRVAHEGPALVLTKDEAERTLELYRRVFNEFNYIG